MGRGAVVYGWRRGWTRGGGRQHGLDKKRACLATVKSMPCNGGTARGGIGKGAHEGWRREGSDEGDAADATAAAACARNAHTGCAGVCYSERGRRRSQGAASVRLALRACHCSARACYRPCRAARGLGDDEYVVLCILYLDYRFCLALRRNRHSRVFRGDRDRPHARTNVQHQLHHRGRDARRVAFCAIGR
jgi:hypothetical protein